MAQTARPDLAAALSACKPLKGLVPTLRRVNPAAAAWTAHYALAPDERVTAAAFAVGPSFHGLLGAAGVLLVTDRRVLFAEPPIRPGVPGNLTDQPLDVVESVQVTNNLTGQANLAFTTRGGNAVAFGYGRAEEINRIAGLIRHDVWARRTSDAPVAPTAERGSAQLADQLARLGELHQQGVLTATEFAAAKARALNG